MSSDTRRAERYRRGRYTAHPPERTELLPAFLDALPDGVLLLDPLDPSAPWRVVAHNRAAARLYGLSRRRLARRRATQLARALAAIALEHDPLAHLRRAGVERVETSHTRRAGEEIVVESALSPVVVGGREYIVAVDRDITARRNAESELRRRAAISRCAGAVARQLSEPLDEIGSVIDQALAAVGAFLDTDRMCLRLYDPDQASLHVSHEWRGDIADGPAALTSLDLGQLPWLAAKVARQQLLHIPDLDSLPPEAVAERATLAAQGVRSLLAVPIVRDDQVQALVCGEGTRQPRRWTSEEIGLLLQVAESLGQALERRQTLSDSLSAAARYRVLTSHTADVISLHDAGGAFTYCSPAALTTFGYDPAELTGRTPERLVHPEDLPGILSKGKVHDTGAITTVYRIRHRDGYFLWVETSARAVCDPQTGAIREIIAVTRDIDARKSYEAKIEQLAYYDPLTGLANRRFLYDRMHRVLGAAGRSRAGAALLYLDLDRFKTINDTLGHDAGDELLIQVAGRLQAQIFDGATLARLGGDEFAVLLPEIADHRPAVELARRILEQLQLPFAVRGQGLHLGVSIGIALAQGAELRPEEMLKHADIAMYQAKREGNSYRFYEPARSPYLERQLQIESALRGAIEAEELTLFYQPIRELRGDGLYAVEALVRWPQPDGTLLMPADFIALAEEAGLIGRLDRWVIQQALRQLRDWARQGRVLSVSINLSPRTLQDQELTQFLESYLVETGVAASQVIVEVTESAVMRDPQVVQAVLGQLRQLGVRIALDDFGSGYAALNTARQVPIDILKIDRSFVQGIGTARDETVLRAIIMIGTAIGAAVVAEGVSDQRQRDWLEQAGCRYIQGFGVDLPQPAEGVRCDL